jgi:hypothetical protein
MEAIGYLLYTLWQTFFALHLLYANIARLNAQVEAVNEQIMNKMSRKSGDILSW